MQQSPELLQDMKEQLEIKRQKLRSSGGSIGSSKNIAQHNIKQNIVESCSPYSSPPSNGGAGSKRDRANLTDVLMPSATSADTFYTLANAATRQHGQQQPTPKGGQSGNPGGPSAAKGRLKVCKNPEIRKPDQNSWFSWILITTSFVYIFVYFCFYIQTTFSDLLKDSNKEND